MMHLTAEESFSFDVGSFQVNKRHQPVCGDTFLYRRIKEDKRRIIILSDGLGSGIKASVLSTLTATMALNYTSGFRDLQKSAETIMRTLPVCSVRKISYATFTIVDIDAAREVRIINYDNPTPLIIRNGRQTTMPTSTIEGRIGMRTYTVTLSSFKLTGDDRIILFSDGITQAGMGSPSHPFGWGTKNVATFIESCLDKDANIPTRRLSELVVDQAFKLDGQKTHDDSTCAVIHYRRSKELMLVTGPPVHKENDSLMAKTISGFPGKKIICGGTTAKIISRELKRGITFRKEDLSSALPPASVIEGFDLVTEGIITLHAVEELLKNGNTAEASIPPSPARDIFRLMMESDRIHFLTGTRINEAWQDPELPDEIGLRRTVVSTIIRLLETVYQKETIHTFV